MPPTSAAGSGGETGIAEAEIHSLPAFTTRIAWVFFPPQCWEQILGKRLLHGHDQPRAVRAAPPADFLLPPSLQISCSELHCKREKTEERLQPFGELSESFLCLQ